MGSSSSSSLSSTNNENKISPKMQPRRLFNEQHNDQLYLNDKSMNRKEPGSVCDFVSNKLNQTPRSNNNYMKSTTDASFMTPNNLSSSSGLLTSNSQSSFIRQAKQYDVRQLNTPSKAELHEIVENTDPSLNNPPKPPVRNKIKRNQCQVDVKPADPVRLVNTSLSNHQSENVQPNSSLSNNIQIKSRNNRSNSSPYYETPDFVSPTPIPTPAPTVSTPSTSSMSGTITAASNRNAMYFGDENTESRPVTSASSIMNVSISLLYFSLKYHSSKPSIYSVLIHLFHYYILDFFTGQS